MKHFDCIIIGGGAAGLFCAARILPGKKVAVIEKNRIVGKKLLITGKGRCNVTNASDMQTHMQNVRANSRFLYSALSSLSAYDVMDFFETWGVPLKTERGNRVFPVSDRSSDIVSGLKKAVQKQGAEIFCDRVISVINKNGFQVRCEKETYSSDTVVIATGGKSYPLTGSTGDGYRFAETFGHTVIPPRPSLVPLVTEQTEICRELQGLSLKNVAIRLLRNGKPVYQDFGEMLFTHFGISGPTVLSASAFAETGDVFSIDLKPALSEQELDKRVLSDFNKYKNKNFSNSLSDLLPAKLIPVMVSLSGIDAETKIHSVSKEARLNLIRLLKNFTFTIRETRPIEEAIITAGGVSLKEINPKTMESKFVEGLYFAGEILDLDAYTGGFNLQIAFSTANLAAQAVSEI